MNCPTCRRPLPAALYAEMSSVLLTTTKAARILGLSASTVLRAIQAGKIKSRKTPGGHHRVTMGDVQGFFGGSVQAHFERKMKDPAFKRIYERESKKIAREYRAAR